jgi:hypothetical protein
MPSNSTKVRFRGSSPRWGAMKFCSACEQWLPLDDFAKKLDGKQARCRKCHSVYTRRHYQDNKQYYVKKARKNNKRYREPLDAIIDAARSGGCVDCGETDPVVLDFDHVRGHKIMSVSEMRARFVSEKRLLDEIAKCEVRCANCHRRVTHKRRTNGSEEDGNPLVSETRDTQFNSAVPDHNPSTCLGGVIEIRVSS